MKLKVTDKLINAKEIYRAIKKEDKRFPLTYQQFKSIISIFNKSIVEEILKGYQFVPTTRLGQIEIKKCNRTKYKAIDWGESNKLKARLIKEDKIPYNKKTAPNGVFWHVYHTDPFYFKWNWYRNTKAKFTKNIMSYKFEATDQNSKRIPEVIKNNPIAELEYDIHNKDRK